MIIKQRAANPLVNAACRLPMQCDDICIMRYSAFVLPALAYDGHVGRFCL